ncbi:MAG TPA: hypothetical protein VGG39_06560 [Polyangiaceae bacterium]|jgi:hypothetical protein
MQRALAAEHQLGRGDALHRRTGTPPPPQGCIAPSRWNVDSALALGYVDGFDAGLLDKIDHVRAVLVKNVR